jgi:hypothetical protein
MPLSENDTWEMVVSKRLPPGSWAAVATVNTSGLEFDGDHEGIDVACQLRNGNDVIGGASDRRPRERAVNERRTLTMVGGAQVPESGGEVSVWCRVNGPGMQTDGTALMMFQVGNFF